MGDKEVNITYETLFELLRIERSREELQKLDKGFFSDVVEYLREKQHMIDKGPQDELFSTGEREKLEKQLENVKKIIRELYDKRERKIAELAMYKAKTNSELIDKNSFLDEEKRLFDELVSLFKSYRADVLMNVLNMTAESRTSEKETTETEDREEKTVVEEKEEVKEEVKEEEKKETILIKFLESVPKFVGRELEVYGPFKAGDTVSLPAEIAQVLVNKEKAEETD